MRRDLQAPIAPTSVPAGVSIAPFTPDMAPACRELMNRVYGEAFGDTMPFDIWWPWVSQDAEYDPSMMFVATAGSDVVGFCHGWREPFIKDLVVGEAWRRRGLGAALLSRALEAYASRGAASVDLKTDVANLRARALYKKLGFVVVERLG
jgi:ribosomal protein S18 acetylase RimI-like enzyme